jgi:hypothetical protein
MDEKVSIDEKKESSNHDSIESKKLESHSIYTYLIAHPSILIAVISAFIAILSFFINSISYMKETQILRFWNIDPTLVSLNNQQLFYSLCFSLLFSIISFIAMGLISNTYIAYRPFVEYMMSLKVKLSRLKKN